MSNPISIADSDALIALTLEKDPHHQRAINISQKLYKDNIEVVFPVTVFPEAITSLKRAANQPQKAEIINNQLKMGAFHIIFIDEEILINASEVFSRAISKQNTFFDAVVAACAEKLAAVSIFSFDSWYLKLGFKLA